MVVSAREGPNRSCATLMQHGSPLFPTNCIPSMLDRLLPTLPYKPDGGDLSLSANSEEGGFGSLSGSIRDARFS